MSAQLYIRHACKNCGSIDTNGDGDCYQCSMKTKLRDRLTYPVCPHCLKVECECSEADVLPEGGCPVSATIRGLEARIAELEAELAKAQDLIRDMSIL